MKYLLVPVLFLLSFSLASACSFTPDADRAQPAEKNIDKYETIFVGEVIEKVESIDGFSGNTYVMKVVEMYKGAPAEKLKLFSPGHSCGSFYEVGRVGLFFLNDRTQIDEANPQYFYSSVDEAQKKGASLFPTNPTPVVVNEPVACTKEYAPVCGEINVQCVQAPCPPIKKTYNNKCLMVQDGAKLVALGECKKPVTQTPSTKKVTTVKTPEKVNLQEQVKEVQEITNSFEGPTAGPLVGFVEPTSPPPVKEIVQTTKKRSTVRVIFDWYKEKIGGLFSWFF